MIWLGLSFSLMASATQVILLRPGSEVTLSPTEPVTVRCEGLATSSFCRCAYTPRLGNYLERLTLVQGQWQSLLLGQYSSESACRTQLAFHPACQSEDIK